ncbi:Glycerophosphoryl diester phosphodiesterase (EC [Olavius algarvensis Delta 1 endosymbiont]|nr:Glycerophosphoryl diester phosphodiesterase (EC [Olavius algarvensis Delta 1 endosymbiont]
MPDPKHKFSIAELFYYVKGDFSHNLSNLLIFDIFFKIVATVVLGPVSAWIFNRLVASSGAWVIGNEQIISFILSPVGLVAFITSGALALAIFFAEQAGMILITAHFNAGRKLTAYQTLLQIMKSMHVLIELGLRQVIASLLYLAPLAVMAGITFYTVSSQHDLNYLLVGKPPIFWAGAAIVGGLGLGALLVIVRLYIHWIFSVPFCVLAGDRPAAALRNSRKLAYGRKGRIAAILLGWVLLILGAGLLSTILFDALSGLILNRIGSNPAITVAVVCILLGLYGLLATTLTFIGFSTSSLVIARLYWIFGGEKKLPPARVSLEDTAGRFIRKSQTGIVWSAVILALILAIISSAFIIEGIELDHRVAVTAHRGSSKDAPENTLSAIGQAIEDGADFAEIDVQETADGVIVLLHDTDLKRIAGVNKKIWQLRYSEIEPLDAGSWFSTDFRGEHVPTLIEAMEKSRNKIKLNIELKFNGHERRLVESVVEIIRNHEFGSQCVITSLNYDGLQKVKNLNPDLKTGFIIAESIGNMFRVGADFLSLAAGIVNPDVIGAARKRNMKIHVWTVNRPARMSHFINLGADNIITDYPVRLAAVIDARDALSDVEKFLLVAADMLKR